MYKFNSSNIFFYSCLNLLYLLGIFSKIFILNNVCYELLGMTLVSGGYLDLLQVIRIKRNKTVFYMN